MPERNDIEIIDPKRFAATVAEELVASIIEVLDEKEFCSFVLSGGSTPGQVYRRLSRPPFDDEIEWSRVKLYWGDERYVSRESENSNFRMVRETLLQPLSDKELLYFPVDTSCNSADECAAKYGETIQQSGYYAGDDGEAFDIVLLGMGTDGHTASLFPGTPYVKESQELCIACQHPTDGTTRISLTPRAIFSAAKIFFLVTGEEKAETLAEVIDNPKITHAQMPATLYREARGQVTWFCDFLAASRLERRASEGTGS